MNTSSGTPDAEQATIRTFVDQRVELMKRHWRNLPSMIDTPAEPPQPRQKVTIAVSRERYALGSQVALAIGKLIGWHVYDRELVDMVAERSVLRSELLESIDEHTRSWLIESLTGLSHPGEISSAGYLHHLKHVMAALASHGECVIVGRGAAAFLPVESTLRVRVQAPLEVRAERLAAAENLAKDEARKQAIEIDRERATFVNQHFGVDLSDPHLFDVIVNTERLSPADCAEAIVAAARTLQSVLDLTAEHHAPAVPR